MASTVDINFYVRCHTTRGQHVFIAGSAEALGSWNPNKALPLVTSKRCLPYWYAGPVRLPSKFEYRIMIFRTDGSLDRSEDIAANRVFEHDGASLGFRIEAEFGFHPDPERVVARQADGHAEIVLKNAGSYVAKIPNGELLTVLGEFGDGVHIHWRGFEGSVKTSNIVRQRTTAIPHSDEFGGEPTWSDLQRSLSCLSEPQRRAAQALLGVAIGDAAGLPFEFADANCKQMDDLRYQYYSSTSLGSCEQTRAESLVRELIQSRLWTRKAYGSPFSRTFSDDTMCTDLKMQAAACTDLKMQAAASADDTPGLSASRLELDAILFRSMLQQYLSWCYVAKGRLFQGTGGFTRDFLQPTSHNHLGKLGIELCDELVFCPTPEYVDFAQVFFAGGYPKGWPSWGNGAVMSLAPQTILAASGKLPASAATVLGSTHQEPTAKIAAQLLDEMLTKLISGEVTSGSELRAACLHSPIWRDLRALKETGRGYLHPLLAFEEFLQNGDCSSGVVLSYLLNLTGRDGHWTGKHCYGNFGELLRVASNCNDLTVQGSIEPVKFSQRALNSVIIGLWCAASASSTIWEVVERCIYVGGDTDTVGAVAGQLAGPMMPAADIVQHFQRFVGLEGADLEALPGRGRVTKAAARRFFNRAVLFSGGRWAEMLSRRKLADPVYEGLTDARGEALPRSSCRS